MKNKKNNLSSIFLIISFFIYIVLWTNQIFNLKLLGLSTSAFSALGIFIASVLLWIFVATDWPSILAILSIGLIPEIGFKSSLQLSFGNETFVFLLFTFIVTYALNKTIFLKRVTHRLLNSKISNSSGYGFIASFLLVVLLISSIMSPTVIFMFLFPLYEELVLQFGCKKGNKSASKLLFALFTTIAIGTAMTPINHVFSVTAISILKSSTNVDITNLQYMILAVPVGIILFGFILIFIRKLDYTNIKKVDLKSLEKLGTMDKREKIVVYLFFLMIVLWMFPEMLISIFPSISSFIKANGIAFPPLLVTVLLLIIKVDKKPLLNISEAISNGVHWPSLILVASTLLLGSTISNKDIGLVQTIQNSVSPIIDDMPTIVTVFMFTILAGLSTNFTSNLVTVTFVSTILITLKPLGVNLPSVISIIGFASSFAIMTAPSMPYVAVSIGSEWTDAKSCIKYGAIFLIISTILLTLLTYQIGMMVF